ncbi:hypothetical protein H310_15379, partial [Aphanomyces invadans]
NRLEEYIANKKNDGTAYNSLLRLCQRFTKRYRFSQRVPRATKLPQVVLAETKATSAKEFWEKFNDTTPSDITNEKAWMNTRVWEMYLTDLLK